MNKRGQFFILIAVILCGVILILSSRLNTYEERILLEDFPDLSANYAEETPKVVNDAILTNGNPETALEDFTKNFTNYARSIDPSLGVIYVYRSIKPGTDENVHTFKIGNFLSKENEDPTYSDAAWVCSNTEQSSCTDSLFSDTSKTVNELSLDVAGMKFTKTVPTKVTNFDSELSTANVDLTTGQFYLQIAGVFYKIGNQPFSSITKSKEGNNIKVEVK
ncbi:MAG: hypothetical protein PHD81_00415 [Candidatus Nanoarchaeia archaeon]|nr:hypothetical protein [Candidatus Nanoarchaeia archaeon]MDD5587553.1 hypothetical protein [Candidatus Nanoarchaeia archaeon]